MKRAVKAMCFCAVSLLFLFIAAMLRGICFLFLLPPHSIMTSTTQLWAKVMCAIVGVAITVEGEKNIPSQHAVLIASNHLSYIDIIVIASSLPALFVAKREVQFWPLLGWLARIGGTIFVNRSLFRGGIAAANEIVTVLKTGSSIHIFPEGTSSNGDSVVPFKPSLFAAALEAKVPVLPVTIRYTSIDGKVFAEDNRDVICWYGAMEFAGHFLRLLQCGKINARITVHPEIIPARFSTPQSLALHTHAAVVSAYQMKNLMLLQEGAV